MAGSGSLWSPSRSASSEGISRGQGALPRSPRVTASYHYRSLALLARPWHAGPRRPISEAHLGWTGPHRCEWGFMWPGPISIFQEIIISMLALAFLLPAQASYGLVALVLSLTRVPRGRALWECPISNSYWCLLARKVRTWSSRKLAATIPIRRARLNPLQPWPCGL
jgi:hypothetical protein